MRLTLSARTMEDVRHVVGNAWERGRQEAARCGFLSAEAQAQHLYDMSRAHGYVLRDGDEPVAVFGAVRSAENLYYTFFAATDKFTEHGREATRFLRHFIAERVAENPGARLELGSLCSHSKADDWFKVLGFKLLKQEGLLRHYLYEPKLKLRLTS